MVIKSNTLDYLWLQDGENGQPGEKGSSLYTWVKYSQNADGTNMTDSPIDAVYIGIAYNKTSDVESTNKADYSWSKILGDDGEDAYTVVMSNENVTFSVGADRKPLSNQSFSCAVSIYVGVAQRSDFLFGTITSPTGLSVTTSGKTITISGTTATAIGADSGSITIPIQIDGITINRTITYSCARIGATGASGNGVANMQAEYAITTDKVNPPASNSTTWKTTSEAWSSGKYRWTRYKVTYTDASKQPTYTTPSCDSSWEAVNELNADLTKTISGVSSVADEAKKAITDKVWQTDITSYDNNQGKAIRDRVTAVESDLSGFHTSVSETYTTKTEFGESMTSMQTQIDQNKEAISLKATSTDISNAIKDITVGGENLFSYTSGMEFSALTGNTTISRRMDMNGFDISVTKATAGIMCRLQKIGFHAEVYGHRAWTFSAVAWASAACTIRMDICDKGTTDFSLTTSKKEISFTATPASYDSTSASYNGFIDVEMLSNATIPVGTVIHFENVQIEAGNTKTAYKPSVYDSYSANDGFSIKWSYENFSTANAGEAYICGRDPITNILSDTNGFCLFNGLRRTIAKQMINPNTIVPYDTLIYIVARLSSATATTSTNYLVWYKDGWKYCGLPTPSAVSGAWTWDNSLDMIIGSFVEPGSEVAFVDCQIYSPVLNSQQVTTAQSIYSRMNTAELTVKNDSIKSIVSSTNMGNTISSWINQDATSVQINASKVNINGALTISAFSDTDKAKINGAIDNINNLQIGGRNLLLNSKTGIAGTNDGTIVNGFMEGTNVGNGSNWREYYPVLSLNASDNPLVGKTITLSGEFKVTDVSKIDLCFFGIGIWNSSNGRIVDRNISISTYCLDDGKLANRSNITANKWFHAYYVFTVPSDFTHASADTYRGQLKIHNSGTSALTFSFRKLKIELGNKATDWSPAPEDADNEYDSKGSASAVQTAAAADATSKVKAVTDNIYVSGKTTINGGKIETGSIAADKIAVTDLSAFSATIGGFSISSNKISSGTPGVYGSVMMSPGAYVDPDLFHIPHTLHSWCFTAGENFGVTVSGDVLANSGVIGGFTVKDNTLSAEQEEFDNIKNQYTDKIFKLEINGLRKGDYDQFRNAISISSTLNSIEDSMFYIRYDGYLYAKSAQLKLANDSYITCFGESNGLYVSYGSIVANTNNENLRFTLNGTTSNYNSARIVIGSKFKVQQDGVVITSDSEFTNAIIGEGSVFGSSTEKDLSVNKLYIKGRKFYSESAPYPTSASSPSRHSFYLNGVYNNTSTSASYAVCPIMYHSTDAWNSTKGYASNIINFLLTYEGSLYSNDSRIKTLTLVSPDQDVSMNKVDGISLLATGDNAIDVNGTIRCKRWNSLKKDADLYPVVVTQNYQSSSSPFYYVTMLYRTSNTEARIISNTSTTGTNTAYYSFQLSSSDIRLKENIKNTTVNAIDNIRKICFRSFDWKNDIANRHQDIGMIADEIEIINQSFVSGGGYDENGSPNYKSINTFYMLGYALKGIQELDMNVTKNTNSIQSLSYRYDSHETMIEQLYDKIARLENEVKILKETA